MKRVWAVALKEIKQVSRDPLSLVMLLGLPVFLLLLFGYALDFDVEDAALAVDDRDMSAASRTLVDAFVHSGTFVLARRVDPGADRLHPFEGRVRAVLVIPEGFGAALAAGGDRARDGAAVQLLLDGTDANTANTLLGHAQSITAAVNARLVARSLVAADLTAVTAAAVDVRPRVWYNPELESSHFLVPGLLGFIMMLTAVLSTALSVVREKELGTLEQLRFSPLTSVHVLLGKTLPFLVLSAAAVVFTLVGARVLFGLVIRGPLLDLAAATLLFLLAGLGWGLLVSTLSDSQAHAFQIGIFSALLPTMLLSGFVFPIRNMPEPLQLLTYAVPARYYLVILRGVVLKGAGLAPYWDQMAQLAAYTLVVTTLAVVRFTRRMA